MIEPYVHVIAGLAVCSRVGDVWTTYQVTPTLKLEANLLARRFGWWYALLTIFLGLVPYASPPLGVMVLTTSFLVSASNASKIVMAKALGEDEMAALLHRVLLATRPWPGVLFLVMPGVFTAALGGSLLLFYHHSSQWGYYFALGMLAYALAVFVWYPLRYFRGRAGSRERRNRTS
jgi:hypothetical protein